MHSPREPDGPFLKETQHPFLPVLGPEHVQYDPRIEQMRLLGAIRTAVHQVTHQGHGHRGGVVGYLCCDLEGAGEDLIRSVQDLGEEVVEKSVVCFVDCAGCYEM